MRKLVICNYQHNKADYLFYGLHDGQNFYQVYFENLKEKRYEIGDVYVGFVKDIAKNIDAAFIEFKDGETGYLSLKENPKPIFLNHKTNNRICQGDYVLVQVAKEKVKMKFPTLTCKISIPGKYIALNINKKGVGFSSKIRDDEFKKNTGKILRDYLEKDNSLEYGAVVRTNAYGINQEVILAELTNQVENFEKILNMAKASSRFSLMFRSSSRLNKILNDMYTDEIDEIVTDNNDIYNESQKLICNLENLNCKYYDDKLLPLYKLYSIESLCENISCKKVWLKSGGFLVIEPTEAMTVIDVNTGKCVKGKDINSTFYKINMEAAEEIAHQIRLRNISGIIIIDFINMDGQENNEKLIDYMKKLIRADRIRTNFVDMTGLGLMEITRAKNDAPVFEQLRF